MFQPFGQAVRARYEKLARGELYRVDCEDLFTTYLLAFPEGTDPIFRVRTEHDCSCCRSFIRHLGNLVSINSDGTVSSVWDDHEGLPYPYNVVSKRLSDIVRQSPILTVFRSKERHYGSPYNYDKETNQRWDHFFGKVSDKHFSATPATIRGELETNAHVMRRGLDEIKADDIQTVLDLIDAKALYRGEEHRVAIQGFAKLQREYDKSLDRSTFVWGNLSDNSARFRNTVVGTLLVDLAEGKDLEAAVKAFESKVAPENYKRPKALITPKMIEQAVETLDNLGLTHATERRHARFEDLSINDVLFVDNAVQSRMKDAKSGLTDLLMGSHKVKTTTLDPKKAQPISMEDFLVKILPGAKSIDVLVENRHAGNFMSVTAPQHSDTGKLFRWDNDFAWSYDGEVADSLRQRVATAGGRVDGALRFSHTWNYDSAAPNKSLMDLHVFMPGSSAHRSGLHDTYPTGQRVGWNHRRDHVSGGVQDVDYVNPPADNFSPVENISFPDVAKMPNGKYMFKIHNWSLRQPTLSGFKAEIEFGGQIFHYDHPNPLRNKEWVTLAEVTLNKGVFSIEHHLQPSNGSQDKWGVMTQTLVPLETLMTSPNHWEGSQVGNKHWFFILRGCLNPNPVRGIYNEYLRADLEKHRKVFEVLGAKTRCQPADEQLSGVGFSSTRQDTVNVVVNGGRTYAITFG